MKPLALVYYDKDMHSAHKLRERTWMPVYRIEDEVMVKDKSHRLVCSGLAKLLLRGNEFENCHIILL